jgi:hypothetical protein
VASAWLEQVFDAQQAQVGGVVRRALRDVERFSSMAELVDEARRRRFHVIETGDQVVILCHEGELAIHC